MEESEFERRGARTLARLEETLREALGEADVDLSGGILTVEFGDGEKFVINTHGVAKQIWVSANSRASHYGWDGAAWRDTRSGEELFAAVGRMASEKLAQPVTLRS